MEKGVITLGTEAVLHQIFLKLRGIFGAEATDIWPRCYLPSSNDRDPHNSHTEHNYYDWFLIDSPRSDHVVLVFFRDKLVLTFLERENFKQRINALRKALREKDDELAKRWCPEVNNLSRLYDLCLSMSSPTPHLELWGLGIVDKHIQTTKSVLLGTEDRKEFEVRESPIIVSSDMPESVFSPDLIDKVLAFLVWKIANPNGTTFEAQAAGKFDLFPARE
ncbi:MAG: hypothetical protein WC242_02605 [Candidatus Paceibacterota bacterium]|jgi:hypothetical protein